MKEVWAYWFVVVDVDVAVLAVPLLGRLPELGHLEAKRSFGVTSTRSSSLSLPSLPFR